MKISLSLKRSYFPRFWFRLKKSEYPFGIIRLSWILKNDLTNIIVLFESWPYVTIVFITVLNCNLKMTYWFLFTVFPPRWLCLTMVFPCIFYCSFKHFQNKCSVRENHISFTLTRGNVFTIVFPGIGCYCFRRTHFSF